MELKNRSNWEEGKTSNNQRPIVLSWTDKIFQMQIKSSIYLNRMFNPQLFPNSLGKYFALNQSLGNCYGLKMERGLAAIFVVLT